MVYFYIEGLTLYYYTIGYTPNVILLYHKHIWYIP